MLGCGSASVSLDRPRTLGVERHERALFAAEPATPRAGRPARPSSLASSSSVARRRSRSWSRRLGGVDLALVRAHRARRPAGRPQRVEDRALDAATGVGRERGASLRVEATGGLHETDHRDLDELVTVDAAAGSGRRRGSRCVRRAECSAGRARRAGSGSRRSDRLVRPLHCQHRCLRCFCPPLLRTARAPGCAK